MEFTNLKTKDLPSFLKLYNESFPENERRVYKDEKHLAEFMKMKSSRFHVIAAMENGILLAFLSYWIFKGYIYIEHFAVQPESRGKKIGSLMLDLLFKEVSPDVLIEVEHPDTTEAVRRIRFYERHGFRVCKAFNYNQPPYSNKQESLPMLLMTHGSVDLYDMQSIREMLFEVYNVCSPIPPES